MSSFFDSTAASLFGSDVTNLAGSMLSQASEAIGIPTEQEPLTEEDMFRTSLGYFLCPSDPLGLVCQTLEENKATDISTETFVLESNPSKVFAKKIERKYIRDCTQAN